MSQLSVRNAGSLIFNIEKLIKLFGLYQTKTVYCQYFELFSYLNLRADIISCFAIKQVGQQLSRYRLKDVHRCELHLGVDRQRGIIGRIPNRRWKWTFGNGDIGTAEGEMKFAKFEKDPSLRNWSHIRLTLASMLGILEHFGVFNISEF